MIAPVDAVAPLRASPVVISMMVGGVSTRRAFESDNVGPAEDGLNLPWSRWDLNWSWWDDDWLSRREDDSNMPRNSLRR